MKWAIEIQSLSQIGLTYTKDVYDRERYQRLREISAEMLAKKTEVSIEKVKDLFCNGMASSIIGCQDISVKLIKNKIKEMVDLENKKKPLADQAICDLLNKDQINISRRTVAKYREELGIQSSSKRKRI